MKKITIAGSFLTVVAAGTLMFTACTKQATSTNSGVSTTANEISTSDVTEAVTQAVSGTTSGLVTQSQQATALSASASLPCGGSKDSTISGTSPAGSLFTWSYDLNYSRTSICSGGSPAQYNTTITGSSSYSALVMSSSDSTNAQIAVSGIQSSASNYVLNETYTRTGTIQSLIGSQHSFTSTLTITSSNINISKSSNQVISGTASVQFTGKGSGNSVSHTATITFLGNNQATLVLDNGSSRNISW